MQSYLWADVMLGNILTISIVWGMFQFQRHDYKAPWLAYAACVIPVLMLLASFVATGNLPPQLDALALR